MEKKKNVPVLRFPEFSGDWEKKKLGEITTKMQSGVSRKLNDSDIGLPILRSNNIQNGGLDVTDIKYWYLKDDQGVNLENYYLKENDVLVNFINSLAQIGKVALFSDLLNRDTIFTTNLLRLSFKNIVDTRFVFYNFNLKRYQDYIQSITKPAVNQASFTTKEFQNYILDLATLPEQQKISSVLTAVDNKLQAFKKKKNLLEQYKKGMMQKIFSQELRFKDDNGAAFPKWEKKKLGDISHFLDGRRKPIKESDRTQMKGDIPYYGASGIIDYVNDFIFDEDIILLGEDGENIISRNLPLAFRVSGKCWINNHAHVIKPNNKINIDFLTLSLERISYVEYNTGTAQPKLNQEICKKIPLILPCIEEQTKIANFLSAIDEKINLCNAQIEKTEQWKKGLLQKMFV